MAGVELAQVGMRFGDGFVALDQIDLQISDGEFIALVGPSGSGKTTLLRTVAGFLTPTSGSITVDDVVVASPDGALPPEARQLGMVFQQHAIWPHMSVGANVGYPLRIQRWSRSKIAERVSEVLELVGLAGFADRNPATLSGGQRQRVALARALAATPRVLLLDEALSALDEPLRDQLRVELKALTLRLGLTVVHVTHDRNEALALADRVVVLDHGRIVQLGTSAEILHSPASPFVASFLSDATVLGGEVDQDEFVADGHPLRLAGDQLVWAEPSATGRSAGQLAVLPDDVELVAATDGAGEVISALFGRSSCDVLIEWKGLRLRCQTDWLPRIGTRVQPLVRRAIFYPQGA